MSADGNHLYALGNPTGGPNEFTISNLDGTRPQGTGVGSAGRAFQRVFWTPAPHEPFAAVAFDGKPKVTYLCDRQVRGRF